MWGRAVRLGVLVATLAAACGGKSTASPEPDDDGSRASGGSSEKTGGSREERCTAPRDAGNCQEQTTAWYYEARTGICRPFVYGGCGGNANRYSSLADCQASCASSAAAYDACTRNSDCVVALNECCQGCGNANVGLQNTIAYNWRYSDFIDRGASCLPPYNNLRFFVGECVQNRCRVTELLNSSATECRTADDCVYHRGVDCCESCDGSDVIAISKYGNFAELTCAGDELCPQCVPPPIEHVSLTCDGYCRATPWLTP